VEAGLAEVNALIAKVDIDGFKDIKESYDVIRVPTFLYFDSGIEVFRHTGIKTIGQMKEIILNLDRPTV
jgi:thiol-disulfide isomerase/thioredoxin